MVLLVQRDVLVNRDRQVNAVNQEFEEEKAHKVLLVRKAKGVRLVKQVSQEFPELQVAKVVLDAQVNEVNEVNQA